MSPSEQDHEHFPTSSLSEAGYQVNETMYALARDEAIVRQRRQDVREAVLSAVLDAGMSMSALARLTGYSRRHIGRLLREAIPWTDDDVDSTGSSLAPFPNL